MKAFKQRIQTWRWLLGFGISAGLLLLIIARIDRQAMWAALTTADPRWLSAAVSAFGAAIVIGALRWRVAQRACGLEIPFPLTLRASLAGQFFNVLFFGPAGGDVAKAALYSRHGPHALHELLASSVMDRGFSVGGSLILGALTLGLIIQSPALENVDYGALVPDRALWLLGGCLLLALTIATRLGVWRWPFLRRLGKVLRGGGQRLVRRPLAVLGGCLLGTLGQLLMSAVLAFGLVALAGPDPRWLHLLWAFPLINSIAAMPLTIGGAGLREALGILILGYFGVAAPEVVAAGLVCLAVYLFWAAGGAGVVYLELRRDRHRDGGGPSPRPARKNSGS